jgi:hypothetical protein
MTVLLVIIGVLYLWFGVASVATGLYFLVYGPPLFEGLSFVFVALPILTAVASLAIAYAFFRRRRWGRYLALTFNGVYLALWLGGFAIAQLTERPELTLPAVIVLIGVLALLGGIIVLCLQPSVRTVMRR